jgi:hypothetical protein
MMMMMMMMMMLMTSHIIYLYLLIDPFQDEIGEGDNFAQKIRILYC